MVDENRDNDIFVWIAFQTIHNQGIKFAVDDDNRGNSDK